MSRPFLSSIVLSVASLVIWWRALFSTYSLALENDKYTQILLIFPICAALIFIQRDLLPASPRPNFRVGACLFLLAILVGLWGKLAYEPAHPDVALTLSMAALVTWWVGIVIFCFGMQTFRAVLFPLLFLYWMVPLPAFVVDGIVSLLQHTSAQMSRFLFALAGLPVSLNGIVISIPGLDIEVAQECSSIRSSLMLLVASMVLAHLFLSSPWRKTVAVLFAVPLSVAKNAVRIFTLALLGTNVDSGFLTGRLHRQGGIVFFLLALAALCLVIWILRRTEAPSRSPQAHLHATSGTASFT